MRKALLAAGVALALAACQQTPPPRRAGLWQQSFSKDGNSHGLGPMQTVSVCVDPKTEAKNAIFNHDLAVKLAKARHCDTPTASRGLDGLYRFTSSCPLPNGNGKQLLEGTLSGDLTTTFHLHLRAETDYSPPFTPLNYHHVSDIDGKWLGPCPPGMAAGDMQLANGVRVPGGRMAIPADPHHGRPPPVSAPTH
jgi:hypothetical protein